MKSDEMRWICDKCGEPIANREGGIHAYNLKPTHGRGIGGLPSKPSPTEPVGMKPGDPWSGTFQDLIEMDFDQLYRSYVGKNVLNFFRQDHGYKEGSYIKVWHGREDNEHLAELLPSLDISSASFRDDVYQGLQTRYPD